ncbi:WbqC family protein [Stigmatella sp. ncwal1]|uniref:WbqC family protein n=1 Tax=Stigmatella ashevillensis TaxID=2995309 RepID=A0ABT5D3M5_9BACT|nr:WbqC family protein [Stigmatella ashevillena]MDC0707728.1 WbqC family protein [Stigmatella ashevillena]
MSGTPGVVVAEQPHYLPWLDFYEQLARAHTLVVLDNVQWLRRGWQRRARVALPHHVPTPSATEPGFQWLTVPLEDAHRDSLLSELAVDSRQPWARKHLQAFRTLYGQRPYFRTQVLPRLEFFYAQVAEARGPGSLLSTLLASMALFSEPLGLSPRVVLASTLERSHPDRTGRLASYCAQLGGDTYYSGVGSMYVQPSFFREVGVRLLWQHFRYPAYPQGREGRFVVGLSIVDVLSNVSLDEVREWLKPSPWGPFAPPAG